MSGFAMGGAERCGRGNPLRGVRRLGVALLALAAGAGVAAEEPAAADLDLGNVYAMGIAEYDLDPDTQVIGWRISNSWYLGQRDQKGAEDGLSLVWQGKRQQVSLSLEEIRFVRRF